ncbi:1-acyl-sn-glycerol-3-phosphate acyltransferase [Desulfosudis oleivorans]|uniref:Glycerol-3-phosphate acyltransferase n=1 Tax=Desulfosudis oleivorans (strain DSM 6200 / JCM 39069 / Hxd3) TaxID=96561 RepID=A8ZTB2_DESOH|nr:1-acyl-sn-glycerol-3-phosphate acyltransferase [Desulfosudis oleivorans]ABW67795.1 Glycerol-3-phosphate O-acyltransferase [Desulfosudis oleivorans Hxd3]
MFDSIKSAVSAMGRFFAGYTGRLLDNTHDHFLSFFPQQSGILTRAVSALFFSKTAIGDDKTARIQENSKSGIIVYVSKYKSKIEFLLCNTQYARHDLPAPEVAIGQRIVLLQPAGRIFRVVLANLDYFFRHFSFLTPYKTDYFKKQLTGGSTAFFSLFGNRTFYPRLMKSNTNPVQELIRIQKSTTTPIFIVPQVLFFSKRPLKTKPGLLDFFFGGLTKRPGRIRRLFTLFSNPKSTFLELCEPINLKYFLEDPENINMREEYQALALRRLLLSRINLLRQRVTGPVLKSREEIKEAIMGSRRLQSFVEEVAAETGQPVRQTSKEAYEYLDEIAANYSLNWVMTYDMVLTWMLKHIFDGMAIDHENLNRLKQVSQQAPLIFVPTHKSHLDYLVLSYVLYYNNIACPHIAAGKNLSFWPLGPIFRGGGAFFMRRTFKGQKLYSKVFFEYIYKILQEGFNVEFFLEGGRSRTGKMLSPKTGLLSIILDAYAQGACSDLMFVPVNIGYDRIIEEASYIREIKGGEKKAENLPELIKARKSLKSRYGKVYVNFNEPLSLKEFLAHTGTDLAALDPDARREFIGTLSHILTKRIDNVTTVTPYSIVSCAILTCPRKRFTSDYLMSIMETYLTCLQSLGVRLADTITSNHAYAFNNALDAFVSRKLIEHFEIDSDKENPLFMINESKRPTMEYYKNTCICFFVPVAFTALAVLERNTFQFNTTDLTKPFAFLRHLLENEFVLSIETPDPEFIKESMTAFQADDMIIPGDQGHGSYDLTPEGLKKLKLFAAFLAPYFESYLVVLNYLKQKESSPNGKPADEKEEIKHLLAHGKKMFKNNEIERLEALSKLTVQNAYHFFMDQQVITADDRTKADFYEDRIHTFLMLMA